MTRNGDAGQPYQITGIFCVTTGLHRERLDSVSRVIAAAEKRAGRKADSTRLIVVSKTFGAEDVRLVLNTGHRVFGENRVQESQAKWPLLREEYEGMELHLIGPLQSNKTAEAVALFDVIHTVDRDKIAKSIAKEMARQNKTVKLFVQVNTGEEEQKAGIGPRDAVDFVQKCQEVYGLDITGLMCIPPFDENPGPHFALLQKLGLEAEVKNLSMGMSADFETAVEFGATHVRVGSAVFGVRQAL